MNIRRLIVTATAAAALTSIVAGCGDTDDGGAVNAPESTTAAGGGAGEDAGTLEFTSADIKFTETDASAPAGELAVTLDNEGSIEHSWQIEDHEDDLRLHVVKKGDTDEGTITLEAGTYTYYCDIPGHRDAGMEGTLTVG